MTKRRVRLQADFLQADRDRLQRLVDRSGDTIKRITERALLVYGIFLDASENRCVEVRLVRNGRTRRQMLLIL